MNSRPSPSFFSPEFVQRHLPGLLFGFVFVATIILWNHHAGRSVLVGHANTMHTVVSAVRPGTVIAVKADLLQHVKRGDVLARIIPADLDSVCAELASKVETLRAQLLASSDRNNVNYQGLRLDLLRRNIDLATASAEHQFADGEYTRYAALHENHLVSDADLENRRANRDALAGKVDALTHLTSELSKQADQLQPAGGGADNPIARAISAATIAQEKQLAALRDAGNLRAPTDGIVSHVHKEPGENVAAGDAIVTLGALRPTRIVAYARQPLDRKPAVGDIVQISTNTSRRVNATAHILSVGTQLEAIEPRLLPSASVSQHVAEYGLPLLVELPAGLDIAPGEVVSLTTRTTN